LLRLVHRAYQASCLCCVARRSDRHGAPSVRRRYVVSQLLVFLVTPICSLPVSNRIECPGSLSKQGVFAAAAGVSALNFAGLQLCCACLLLHARGCSLQVQYTPVGKTIFDAANGKLTSHLAFVSYKHRANRHLLQRRSPDLAVTFGNSALSRPSRRNVETSRTLIALGLSSNNFEPSYKHAQVRNPSISVRQSLRHDASTSCNTRWALQQHIPVLRTQTF
jgi:hypothetical protein